MSRKHRTTRFGMIAISAAFALIVLGGATCPFSLPPHDTNESQTDPPPIYNNTTDPTNDGATYIGSHMDSFGAAGFVAAGTPIGTVGDSGNAIGSRPHVHFEIHPDDGPAVNPYPYLEDACG